METLWVDFQNAEFDRVPYCNGTLAELKDKRIELREGLNRLIWSEYENEIGNPDNLIVEATVRYSLRDKCWVAQFNERDLKNQSQK
jgi:hypothetical protein